MAIEQRAAVNSGLLQPGPTEYPLLTLHIDGSSLLGAGGTAELWRCHTPDRGPAVLKRYDATALPKLNQNALVKLVEWPQSLTPADRDRLHATCAWPIATVTNDGTAIGVVMPEAPPEFFMQRDGIREPRHFTRVAVRIESAEKRRQPYYDFPHKVARLGHLLVDLQFLHYHGILIGDLQPNNILTTGTEYLAERVCTRTYLIDCDSFILGGESPTPALDPLPWRPPYPTTGFSETTDLFKFALLTVRCLAEDLAVTSADLTRFGGLLPTADRRLLHALLTNAQPGVTAADLRALARAWQGMVAPNGRLYRRTDHAAREPWTPAMRDAHIQELIPGRRPTPPQQGGPPYPNAPTTIPQQAPKPNRAKERVLVATLTLVIVLIGILAVYGATR